MKLTQTLPDFLQSCQSVHSSHNDNDENNDDDDDDDNEDNDRNDRNENSLTMILKILPVRPQQSDDNNHIGYDKDDCTQPRGQANHHLHHCHHHPDESFRKMGGHDMLDLDEWGMVRDKMLRLHTDVTDSVKG